ncbi:hypothetical protein IFM89_032778 [Coptis chinensis]|uniref:DDE Tnp4 domain-containing protein n=1 Tax=Coptis chinensis TaxID=261450 RepID=A0A835ME47_9MAGN|nr:hypothetical protein IFM89_032778 [Coptis chinensis]
MDFDDELDEIEEYLIEQVIAYVIGIIGRRFDKQPCNDSMLSGGAYMNEVLEGHNDRCRRMFRMDKPVFVKFCKILKNKELLQDSFTISDCIGALDGAHIPANLPLNQQVSFHNRKNDITQNVLVAYPDARFPHPPEGKYYVVDAGYANTKRFLAPYRGVRYHLQDYRGRKNPPRTKEELYNHRHSSLRNVTEHCFGVLKSRFLILKFVPAYPFETQRDIVFAACVLHNYIRLEGKNDWIFTRYENMADENVPSEENDQVEVVASRSSARVQRVNQRQASLLRDSIAHDLWSARD